MSEEAAPDIPVEKLVKVYLKMNAKYTELKAEFEAEEVFVSDFWTLGVIAATDGAVTVSADVSIRCLWMIGGGVDIVLSFMLVSSTAVWTALEVTFISFASAWVAVSANYRDWETDRKSTRLNSSH